MPTRSNGSSQQLGQRGFTLLEVLIAFSIFFVSFAVIASVISGSLRDAARTQERNIVGMLAKRKMVELEASFETRSFDEFKPTDQGAFEEPYQDYTWVYEVKELKFPNIAQAAGGGDEAAGGGAPQAQQGAAGDQMGRLVTQYLSQAVREVRLTVRWPSGKAGQPFEYRLATLWINLNANFQLSQ